MGIRLLSGNKGAYRCLFSSVMTYLWKQTAGKGCDGSLRPARITGSEYSIRYLNALLTRPNGQFSGKSFSMKLIRNWTVYDSIFWVQNGKEELSMSGENREFIRRDH